MIRLVTRATRADEHLVRWLCGSIMDWQSVPPTQFEMETTLSTYFNEFEGVCTDKDIRIIQNASEAENFTYQPGATFFTLVCLPVLLFVGLTGNISFIYVVWRLPKMKTITNFYLVGLSIADSLFLISAIGSKLWMFIQSPLTPDDGPLGSLGCILVNFVSSTTYIVSLICITLVSLERFWSVCRPHRKRDSNRKVLVIMAVSSLLSALLSASFMPSFAAVFVECFDWPDERPYNTWPKTRLFCEPIKRWHDLYTNGSQTIPFFISLVVNVILYHRIIRGLHKSMKSIQGKVSARKERSANTRNQVARMLVINGIVFFLCLAPFELMSLFYMIADLRGGIYLAPREVIIIMLYFARAMSYLNSAVNPIIYTALSVKYREAFKHVFIPNRCIRKRRNSATASASVFTYESKM